MILRVVALYHAGKGQMLHTLWKQHAASDRDWLERVLLADAPGRVLDQFDLAAVC